MDDTTAQHFRNHDASEKTLDKSGTRLSSIVLLNGQSVSPAATSTSKWKLPTSPDIYISGDFNYPNIDWDVGNESEPLERYLQEFIDRNFLTQVVNSPIRKNNVLDIVSTNVHRYVTKLFFQMSVVMDITKSLNY